MEPQLPRIKDKTQRISIINLVRKYQQLLKLVPEKLQWTEAYLEDNPSAYYRLLQLKGLCRVFKVETIDNLITGNFIWKRDLESYSTYFSIKKSIKATIKKNEEYKKMGSDQRCHVSVHSTPKTEEDIRFLIDCYQTDITVMQKFLLLKNSIDSISADEEERKYFDFMLASAERNVSSLIDPGHTELSIQDAIDKYELPDIDVYELDKKLEI